jgi:peptidoglycan/xylan/chitin deacetylase (PgdA/CDA1 family)
MSRPGALLRRARSWVPARGEDRARLAEAGRLAARTRRAPGVRAAALVLHAVEPRSASPETMVDAPFPDEVLHPLVGHLRRGYDLVPASELLPRAHGRRAGELVPVALTFDDDLVSHADVAAPLLRDHGVVGTAFLCGAREPFWWQRLQAAVNGAALRPEDLPAVEPALVRDAVERRPWAIARLARAIEELPADARDGVTAALAERAPELPAPLDADGRRRLADSGWEIGFHTRGHDLMPALDDGALARAVADGRDALPEVPLSSFAYPHGKAGPREAGAVRAAGYRTAFTGAAAVVMERTDPGLVPRLQPDPGSPGRAALALARALASG